MPMLTDDICCSRCGITKPHIEFRTKKGLRPVKVCHTCINIWFDPERTKLTKRLRQQFKDFKKNHKLNGGHRIHNTHYHNMLALQDNKCVICKTLLGEDCHIDHITPVSLGGSNTLDNLQLLCASCNMVKGNMVLPKFIMDLTHG